MVSHISRKTSEMWGARPSSGTRGETQLAPLFNFGRTTSVMDRTYRSLAANRTFSILPLFGLRCPECLQPEYAGRSEICLEGLGQITELRLTAFLTLALGIGANAVVFSVLNALVIHTLNVPDAQNLRSIEEAGQSLNSYPDYQDLRDRNQSFAGVLAFNLTEAGLDTGSDPSRVWLYEASGNYFDTLRVKPYLGRFFHASDEHGPNSSPYVVLSYAYWHSHLVGIRRLWGARFK